MSSRFFERKKPLDLKEFYKDWSKTVIEKCLPLLRQSPSSGSSSSVYSYRITSALQHLGMYYKTLNLAAADSNNIHNLLFPTWRNPLEKSIFFLGDIHPYVLTSLVKSFISRANQDSGEFAAWKGTSVKLTETIDQAEQMISAMVQGLLSWMTGAQRGFVTHFSENWVSPYNSQLPVKTVMAAAASVTEDEAAKEETEDLKRIYLEANELRRLVIKDILEATNEEQAALFLLRLLEILVGFQDQVQKTKPDPENDKKTLWIGGLKSYMDKSFLYECFSDTGDVVECEVIIDKQTGNNKGYGFIKFKSHDAAAKALQVYNNAPIPNISPTHRFRLNWSDRGASYSIFVGDLSDDVTSSVLGEKFRGYSSVINAKVMIDGDTRQSKGYGFVNFSDQSEQFRAVVEMNGVICSTKPMRVALADPNNTYFL